MKSMNSFFRKSFLLILVLLTIHVPFSEAYSSEPEIKYGIDKFANIQYPAPGIFDVDEGTVDILSSIAYDPFRKHNMEWYSPLHLFYIDGISRAFRILASHSYNRKLDRFGHSFKITAKSFDCRQQIAYDKTNGISPGRWHLLTFTWKRVGKTYRCKCYLDGRLLEKNESRVKQIPFLKDDSQIIIGAKYFNSSYGTIDSFRISAVERSPQEISKAWDTGLPCDKYTLLFDNFGKIKRNKKNSQRALSIPAKGPEGRIYGTFEIVDGKKGKAIKLHVVDE